jgi:Tfp pilus assembly protein PilZ
VASIAPSEKRSSPRLRPRGVVSLAIYQGERIPPAYGIINDITVGGACIQSDRILAEGQDLQLRIQFESEVDLLEATARVAWTRPFGQEDEGFAGGGVSGLAFTSAAVSRRLRRLLYSSEFEVPDAGSRQFDEFLTSLKPYLKRLGLYVVHLGRPHDGH